MGERTSFELAVYYFTWDDMQLNWSGQNNIQIQANAGDATGIGVDYSLIWSLSDSFSIGLSGNVNSTEIDKLIDPSFFANTNIKDGKQISSVPESNHTLQLNLRNPIGAGGLFTIGDLPNL